jgi:trans-aconitate methyltransferase
MGGLWGSQREGPYTDQPPCVELIKKAIQVAKVGEEFTLIDFCCGEGLVMEKLLLEYPKATFLGVDMNKYKRWEKSSIRFIEDDILGWMRSEEGKATYCDIVIMTDTWRNCGWSHTALTNWIKEHSRFFISDLAHDSYIHVPFPFEEIGTFPPFPQGNDTLAIVLCFMEKKND